MSKLTWLRNLFVPAVIGVTLFIAFVGYYLYWVPDRQRHLDDRGFRTLKTLSEQIRLTISTYDKMLDSAAELGITQDSLGGYLKSVVPQLQAPSKDELQDVVKPADYGDPPKITVTADEGTHFLYLALSHRRKPAFAARADLDKIINKVMLRPSLSPFDVLLVAQSDGTVIYQNSLSGVVVAKIDDLEDVSGETKGKDDKKTIHTSSLLQSSRLEEIRIAGARYRLYSQPLQIPFFDIKDKESNDRLPKPWVLCGLVRADRFRSESQLIPYAYILIALAAILLAVTSYPFLRLYLSKPGERLRARDVTVVAIFACFVAAAITFILADVFYWQSLFGPAATEDMANLAKAIDDNLTREREAAFAQLDEFNSNDELNRTLALAENSAKTPSLVIGAERSKKCDPEWACRINLLADMPQDLTLQHYPYLLFASWSDAKGNQRIKWTTRAYPTPFIPLDNPSVPYYADVKRALKDPGGYESAINRGIGSQYSPTTGMNITVFWKIRELADKSKFCASLVTQPVSVMNAVLPGEFQFAVLDRDGTVIFHSDPSRNLRENFFAETDQNPQLRAAVKMRGKGPILADYLGRPHRMYVQPMTAKEDGKWMIVIFRDLHREEMMNLEILSLVSTIFVLYCAVVALAAICVRMLRKGRRGRWLWPDSRKARPYWTMAGTNGTALVILPVLPRFAPPVAVLVCSVLIPVATFVLCLVVLGGDNPEREAPSNSSVASWRGAYFAMCATLLAMLAIVPCVSFFALACSFEHRVFIEHAQLQLEADLDQRLETLKTRYQDLHLSLSEKSQILSAPEDENAHETPPGLLFSYHQYLATSVCPAPGLAGENGAPPSGCKFDLPALGTDSFLSSITISYNELTADDRYLSQAGSDMWRWSSFPSGRDELLALASKEPSGRLRIIASTWTPFRLPWDQWRWWLVVIVFMAAVFAVVREGMRRIFLMKLVAPPLIKTSLPGLTPDSLISDLPMNLLIIGAEWNPPLASLLRRSDIQVLEAEELLRPALAQAAAGDSSEVSNISISQADRIVRDGRPLVLRNFDCLIDDPENSVGANAALLRVMSGLENSIIIVAAMDPLARPSIEASESWRFLLRSFVRMELNAIAPQKVGEDDAEYEGRISANSYYRWVISGLSKPQKLVLAQLAREGIVNPNSYHIVLDLMEQGLIERRCGLLSITDRNFAEFMKHAISYHTVKHWETEIAGTHPFPLQTTLLVLGVGVVAFLIYTQGDVFNTWVTYATGVAASLPKFLQLLDGLSGKAGVKT